MAISQSSVQKGAVECWAKRGCEEEAKKA